MTALLLDLDGVIYNGNVPIQGASETMAWFRKEKIPHLFVSNTTSRSRTVLVEKLSKMEIPLDESQILTPLVVAAKWLRENTAGSIALFAPEAAYSEFDGLDMLPDDAEKGASAVVVGDLGEEWDFNTLNRAFRLLMSEPRPHLLALGMTRYWKAPDGLRLDTAPFIAALETASEAKAIIFGKPSPVFFQTALDRLGERASDTLMIGDDIRSDIHGAQQFGISGILVRTGKFNKDDLDHDIEPAFLMDSIADLPCWWRKNGVGNGL